MKVKKLIELLKKEDPNMPVAVWLASEEGWEIVEIKRGDAVIGKTKGSEGVVLLPAEIPEELQEWN